MCVCACVRACMRACVCIVQINNYVVRRMEELDRECTEE